MPASKKTKVEHEHSNKVQGAFQSLPTAILRQILLQAVQQSKDRTTHQRELLSLCGLCKATRSALLSEAYSSIVVEHVQALPKLARTLKANTAIAASVQQLQIGIEDVYSKELGSKKATNWKGHSLKHILVACTSLRHLRFELGPATATSPLAYLLRDPSATFGHLDQLISLSLDVSEIWMHELAAILAELPSLRSLEVKGLVRGDTHTNRLEEGGARPPFEKLIMPRNTLSSQHVRWLLEGQTGLKELDMALPREGAEAERSFSVIERSASNLKRLALTSSWPAPKSNAATSLDFFLLPTLKSAASSLTSLRLVSVFAPPASLAQIFKLPFDELRTLEIEDTLSSGMRAAVEQALRGDDWVTDESEADDGDDDEMDVDEEKHATVMPRLEEVISFGVKKGNAATGKSGKHFVKVCRSRKVQWRVE